MGRGTERSVWGADNDHDPGGDYTSELTLFKKKIVLNYFLGIDSQQWNY